MSTSRLVRVRVVGTGANRFGNGNPRPDGIFEILCFGSESNSVARRCVHVCVMVLVLGLSFGYSVGDIHGDASASALVVRPEVDTAWPKQ
eukprot:1348235-Amorphochlora_amoeboformis.AAC.2